MFQIPESEKARKAAALAILAFVVFLINKKLFASLLFAGIGCFLIYTFGRNIHAKHPSVVPVGIALGILFFIIALLLLFL